MQRFPAVAALVFCFLLPPAFAQSSAPASPASTTPPRTAAEFFARVDQLSDLEASGIPFHLKATYVAVGDTEFKGNGTYEYWWQSEAHWRREATLGSYRYISIQDGSKKATYASSTYMPLRLILSMGDAGIQLDSKSGSPKDWSVKRKKRKGTDYIVIRKKNTCDSSFGTSGCKIEYTFTPEGHLRIWENRTLSHIYDDYKPFEKLLIPRSVTLTYWNKPMLTFSVTTLEPLSPGDARALIGSPIPVGMAPIVTPWDARSSPDFTPPKILRMTWPTYPESARVAGFRGIVRVIAYIDDHGNVPEPYVFYSSGDPVVDQAAVDCVRQWKFQPATLGNAPTTATTILPVNFAAAR